MVVMSVANCDLTADAIAKAVEDGTAPSWMSNNVDWYRSGMIDCGTMLNATGWLLQEDVINVTDFTSIFQEILQDANLVSLGESQIDQSEALARQVAIREAQRVEDQEVFQRQLDLQQQFNDLVSGQLVDLGESSVEISQALEGQKASSFTGDLITGALGGSSLIVLGIILVMMIGRK